MSEGGDDLTTCVACGEPIEIKNNVRSRHTCPKKREAARKSANTRAHDKLNRRASFGERLSTGFEMLDDDEHITEDE